MAVDEVNGWVWASNVEVALRQLALIVDYTFDATDWQAVEAGLETTDGDRGAWYSYPLVGRGRLALAVNPGDSPVSFRIRGIADALTRARVETVLSVLADCRCE